MARATLLTLAWLLLLAILAVGQPSAVLADVRTAAVMPLGKGAGGPEFDGLGRALADMMVTDLSQSETLQLVERAQLGLVLDELKLGKSGFLDPKSAQKLGRGLAAQLVITGSFTILKSRFVMDCRIVAVESGSVLVSVRSEGPVDDFIAIEKDVVEKLLAALEVKLSAGERRKLLLATPTESVRALASFGRGVEAKESGLREKAQDAFEEALRQDPDFAKASLALADLASATEKASVKDRERRVNAREQALHTALGMLTPETQRDRGFKDTRASMLDFTIRQELLARTGQHCSRYQELKHYLLRRDGTFEGWFEGLANDYAASWRAGEQMMDARAKDLGLWGGEGHVYTRPGALMFDASRGVTSGMSLLVGNNMAPEIFSPLMESLARCYDGPVQIAEFSALAKRAKRWPWIDSSLFTVMGSGPSTLTPRDSLDLYWAYLRASHRGVDAKVRARTDAVLARHPEGDAYRSSVLSRIKTVVAAGASYESRVAARMGRSEIQIVAAAEGSLARDPKRVRLDSPLCREFVTFSTRGTERDLKRLSELSSNAREDRRGAIVNSLAMELAPLFQAGCFKGKAKIASLDELRDHVAKGLARMHPARHTDSSCLEQYEPIRRGLSEMTPTATRVHTMLAALQRLRHQRCLIP